MRGTHAVIRNFVFCFGMEEHERHLGGAHDRDPWAASTHNKGTHTRTTARIDTASNAGP